MSDFKKMLCAVLLSCVCASTFAGEAAKAAGIVLDLAGAVVSPIRLMQEIQPGQRVKLGPGGKMVLVHYGTCKELTIHSVGSTEVTLQADSYRVEPKTALVREEPVDCQETLDISDFAMHAVGGTRIRGVDCSRIAITVASLKPVFLFAGAHAQDIQAVKIYPSGQTQALAQIPVTGQQALWPAGAGALEAGKRYDLSLLDDHRELPCKATFYATAGKREIQRNLFKVD